VGAGNATPERAEPDDTALAARYPLSDTTLHIGGRDWTITSVLDQDALVESVRTERDLEQFPYGLMLWASAIGLAERLAEEPVLVRGKRVLEIGAGVGLPGLVRQVAGGQIRHANGLPNGRSRARPAQCVPKRYFGHHYQIADWRHFPPDLLPDTGAPFDVVLGSDVLYERALHAPLTDVLARLLPPGDTNGCCSCPIRSAPNP
jgi:predicted nicotinamide N-methyase